MKTDIKGYVDMHMHILPEIDDGSQSIEESMYMLEKAYNEGVRTIVATPHFGYRNPDFKMSEALEKLEELRQKCEQEYPDMRILMGNEILYYAGMFEEIKTKKAASINNSRFVLVEFNPKVNYATMIACVREFKMERYIPIFAHIERYACLNYNEERVKELKRLGALIQVNSEELAEMPETQGAAPKKTLVFKLKTTLASSAYLKRIESEKRKNVAWAHIKSGLVDFIASDAHGDIFRAPCMETAIANVRRVAGDETAEKLIKKAQVLVSVDA